MWLGAGMGIVGLLCLVVSAVLVVNLIASLVSRGREKEAEARRAEGQRRFDEALRPIRELPSPQTKPRQPPVTPDKKE